MLFHLRVAAFALCLCGSLPLLVRTPVIGFRPTLNPGQFHLGVLPFLRPPRLFLDKVTFEVLGGYEFPETLFNPLCSINT